MDITLDDLEVIATLGVGGFGRVEMVKVTVQIIFKMFKMFKMLTRLIIVALQCRNRPSTAFALKCLKKQVTLS